jgi:hypothetical protein
LTDEIMSKVSELALNNIAACLLGVAVTLWYVYVKLQIDDKAREAFKILVNIEYIRKQFYDKSKK